VLTCRRSAVRVAEIADAAGAASELGTPLYDTRGDTAARLALAVAYGCVADGPLLLDNVRMVKDEHFRRWLEIRTRQLRGPRSRDHAGCAGSARVRGAR